MARSDAGEPSRDEGEAAERRLTGAAGVRGGEVGRGDTGTEPEAAVSAAGVEEGVESGAGGCGKRRETVKASMGSSGSPLAAGRAPMAAAAVTASIFAPGECAPKGWREPAIDEADGASCDLSERAETG